MALRQLLLTRERNEKNALLAAIEKEQEELRTAREAWKIRESDAEKALAELEAKTDATEEERKAFDDEAAEIEKEDKDLTGKEEDAQKRADAARSRIEEIDGELEDIRKRFEEGSKKVKEQERKPAENQNERGVYVGMDKRERIVELVKREDVKNFLTNVRGLQNRGVNGAELTIPQVMLPLITEVSGQYSVLEKYMDAETIQGTSAQNILATIPEAVWTETKDWIKELEMNIYQMKTAGNMVAGFIPLHISDEEDSAENLASLIINGLGRSIGRAKDKAMMYGTGVHMPVGIMTRLAAAEKPAWWDPMWVGENAPVFTNLSTTHLGAVSSTGLEGIKLFQEMFAVLGKAEKKYESGPDKKFWAMKGSTWATLQTMMLNFNSAGAVVSAANRQMPIIGGTVEELDFMPDGVIGGGYGGNYKWITRSAMTISATSELRWLQNQILYKGVERADGAPMAGEAFAAFNIGGTTRPTASMEFNQGKDSKEETALGNGV